jgi:hypothetical protein
MDIPPIINQNIGFNMKRLNITKIVRFNYEVKRCNKVYGDDFISKFPDCIQSHLKSENQKFEDNDTILKSPHPIPYNSVTE